MSDDSSPHPRPRTSPQPPTGSEGGGCPGGADPFEGLLRERLRDLADGIRASPGALERLHHAVPARRRRRRRVLALATAAGTFAAAAAVAPAARRFLEPSPEPSGVGATQAVAGSSGASGVSGSSDGAAAGPGDTLVPQGRGTTGPHVGRGTPSVSETAAVVTPAADGGTGHAPAPGSASPDAAGGSRAATPGASAQPPACGAADLAQGPATGLGATGGDGVAYGVVELRNTSNHPCEVADGGVLVVTVPPGSPPVQVAVAWHTAGDAAPRLPVTAPGGVSVAAGQTYEFQFAWMPKPGAEGGCGTDASAAPVPVLGYAPAGGAARVASVPLTAACGGGIVRTDVYASGRYPHA